MDKVGVDIIRDKIAFEESDIKDRGRVRKVRGFVGRSDDKVGEFLIEGLKFTRVKVLIGAPNQVVPVAVQDRWVPWVKFVAIHHSGDDRYVVRNGVEDGGPNTPRGVPTNHGVPQGVVDMGGAGSVGEIVKNTTRLVRALCYASSNSVKKTGGDSSIKAGVINGPDIRERSERVKDLGPVDVRVAPDGAAKREGVTLDVVDERTKKPATGYNCLYWCGLNNPGFPCSGTVGIVASKQE